MAQSRETGTRKLAAVMFTDIKGFSKKMSENESGAFELLKTHDALMRVITAKHDGKVIKSIGDSFMIDFSSAVNAVKAAIDAQKRFWSFNKAKSEFDKIEVRIGIHLGDVMVTDSDMYGDGVNIASRIEAITEPNRICISADIYNQVKNKTDLKVYRIGEMQLKNIPDPVEVFEILIDSIPDLAQPSTTAQQGAKKKHLEDSTDLETAEAKTVEAAKKRGGMPVPKAQDTASAIEAHYQKAEQLYNEGKIDEAERVINEIAKIDPGYHAAMERKKADEEKERRVHEHYQKAGAYLRDGRFDLAENEVKEIFKMFPLHVGAQQLQLQIEEERYKKEEEERKQRLDLERKKREEKDQALDELARHAEEFIEHENFTEAREALHSILALESTYTGIERLEEKIRRAEAAKLERDRAQAFLDEQRQKEEALALNRERQVEMHHKRTLSQQLPDKPKKFSTRVLAWSIVSIVLVLLAFAAYPHIKRILFPISGTVAVLPLSVGQNEPSDDALCYVIPDLLAQELTWIERMIVISPYAVNVRSSDYDKIATDLRVRFVINGVFKRTDRGASITFRLYDSEQHAVLFSDKFETDFRSLSRNLVQISDHIREQLNMDPYERGTVRIASSARGYELFLHGLYQLRQRTPAGLEQARQDFLESARLDSTFGSPLARLSEVNILKYRNSAEPDEALLREAFELNQQAFSLNNQESVGYRNLANIYFLTRRFDKVSSNAMFSLSLQPDDAECYRLLALVSLIGANPDASLRYATHYARLAPNDPDASLVLGLAQHHKKAFVEAMASYKKAISLGLPDSLVTVDYLYQTWSAQENYDAIIQQCQKTLQQYPNDYRSYYWISRAYQMMPKIDAFKEWAERGITLLRQHLEKNAQDADVHAYLALLLARGGKSDEAEAEIAKATALAPASPEIMFRKANLYAILKKPDLSLNSLREALSRDYSFPEIMNPDFRFFKMDTAFASTVRRNVDVK